MISLSRARQLLDYNLSVITIGNKKIPNYPWKQQQITPLDKESFEKNYISTENNKTCGIGIVTGYKGLEVIDIDLKVLPSLKEQQDFWNEYVSFLSDNIDDFDNKFCIYKTVNNGYHILYRCEKIEGNKYPVGGAQLDSERIFTTHVRTLKENDTIYMFTDGYADQFGGEKGKKFMVKRFHDILLGINKLNISDQRNELESQFNNWKGNYEQVDDVLVIGLKIG